MEKILLIVNPKDVIWMVDILQPQGCKVDYDPVALERTFSHPALY